MSSSRWGRGGLWPGRFGGNMDAADVREGTTVYLPVYHEGALFYFGDGHAADRQRIYAAQDGQRRDDLPQVPCSDEHCCHGFAQPLAGKQGNVRQQLSDLPCGDPYQAPSGDLSESGGHRSAPSRSEW